MTTIKRPAIPLMCLLLFSAMAASAGPVIKITPSAYDFGDLKEGVKAVYDFTIENTGDAPLNISRVKTSCGCTASDVQKSVLAPGETTALKVEYNTEGRPGRFTKKVTIFSDDPNRGQSYVTLTGFVESKPGPKITVRPPLKRLDNAKPEESFSVQFKIINTGELDLTVSRISKLKLNERNQPAGYDVINDKAFILKPGESRPFTATVTTPKEGMFRFVYSIMSNDPHLPVTYLRILGQVAVKK